MSLALWLRHHSAACEASLHRYYQADLGDWYRGKITARWLWVRLFNLPMDSPLAISVAGEDDDAPMDAEHVIDERGRLSPPKALYEIPVAGSFAEVGSFVNGADLN